MIAVMGNINTQFGTSYTWEDFQGTNFYKYFYALSQRVQEGEVKTSEIFLKLQQYFTITNERILRPVTTNPGMLDRFAYYGYVVSLKPMTVGDRGKLNMAVNTDETADDYADVKLAICTLLSQCVVAGVVTEGTESESIVFSNGQAFDFKYHLPDKTPVGLRLTVTLSENNQAVIDEPNVTKLKLLTNIAARYRMGKNFEPQRYFTVADAPWSSAVLLEWTDDITGGAIDPGAVWTTAIFDAEFDDLFTFDLANVVLVED